MKRHHVVSMALSLLFGLYCSGLRAQSNRYRLYESPVGPTVVVIEDSLLPVFHIEYLIRNDEHNESNPYDGASRLWQEMLWLRSPQLADSAHAYGLRPGSYTGPDAWAFGLSGKPEYFLKGISILNEWLHPPAAEPLPFLRARTRLGVTGDPSRPDLPAIRLRMLRSLYGERTASQNPEGDPVAVSVLSLPEVAPLDLYLRAPEGALIIIRGPLNADWSIAVADSVFRGMAEGAAGPPPAVPTPEVAGWSQEVHTSDAGNETLLLCWPYPGTAESRQTARTADRFTETLNLRSFALQRALRGKARLVRWEADPAATGSRIWLRIRPEHDSAAVCLRLLTEFLSDSAHFRIDKSDVEDAEAAIRSREAWTREYGDAETFVLGRRWAAGGATYALQYEKDLLRVSASEVIQFGQDWVFGKPGAFGALIPTDNEEAVRQAAKSLPMGIAAVVQHEPDPVKTDTPGTEPPRTDTLPHVTADTAVTEPVPNDLDSIAALFAPMRIYFESGSNSPDAAGLAQIRRVAETLKANPGVVVYVNGFTDGVGNGVKNYQLSGERAQAVKDILVQTHRIFESRLVIRPFGEAFPEYPDDTARHRALNRRVTFELIPEGAPNE